LCVDYRGLNKVTIKNRHPLLLIDETLDRLVGAQVFTKLDLKDAYHRVRIRKGYEWKTAFRTRYGHFEYLVMPFGLANTPAIFQAYINTALAGLLDRFVVVYLDDILIYSKNIEEHHDHVRQVLTRLRKNNLFCKLSKCEFDVPKVEFLGFIVGIEGVRADPERIRSIVEWPELESFHDV
jgi:Reverse transcriptase (RNA-dependent DNA polymerase)